jgi:hypothetical protein
VENRDESLHAEAMGLPGKDVLFAEHAKENREKYARLVDCCGDQGQRSVHTQGGRRGAWKQAWGAVVMDRLLPEGDAFEWFCREHRISSAGRFHPCVRGTTS